MTSDLIRVITDFPKPGIIFKDITPLLADAKALNDCCEKIASYATNSQNHLKYTASKFPAYPLPEATNVVAARAMVLLVDLKCNGFF